MEGKDSNTFATDARLRTHVQELNTLLQSAQLEAADLRKGIRIEEVKNEVAGLLGLNATSNMEVYNLQMERERFKADIDRLRADLKSVVFDRDCLLESNHEIRKENYALELKLSFGELDESEYRIEDLKREVEALRLANSVSSKEVEDGRHEIKRLRDEISRLRDEMSSLSNRNALRADLEASEADHRCNLEHLAKEIERNNELLERIARWERDIDLKDARLNELRLVIASSMR